MSPALGWLRAHLVYALTLAGFLAFYLWTSKTSGSPFQNAEQSDYFNLLADAFLDGQTSLLVAPSPDLLALKDPYDPTANGAFRLHDASLYEGKYFLQWGPVPALLLFIPYRLLPFGDLPAPLAASLLAFAGLLFASMALRFAVRRWLPGTPRWMVGLGVVALGTGSAVPFVLRRVAVYEVSLLGAYAFLSLGGYLLLTALAREGEPSRRRLAGGSLALGLAAGCRPTMAVPAIALAGLTYVLAKRHPGGLKRWAPVVLLPAALCGLGLVVYNLVRFGSPLEFGTKYQLAGIRTSELPQGSLAFLGPGWRSYLFDPAQLSLDFPFFHLPISPEYPEPRPNGYIREPAAGVLTNVPIALLGIGALLALLVKRRRDGATRFGAVVLGLGAALVTFTAFTLFGSTQRYETDFATPLVLAGLIGWFLAWYSARPGWGRRAVAAIGTLAVAWGAAYGVAISFTGYYDTLRTEDPGAYEALADVTSPLPTAVARLKGEPQLIGYSAPAGGQDDEPGPKVENPQFLADGRGAELRWAAGSPGRYRLRIDVVARDPGGFGQDVVVDTPDVGRTQRVRVRNGTELIDLPLRRGLNRVRFTTPGPIVELRGVRLEPAR